ncbi:MAG: 50S ribosomal protein L25/general stress protein Ctc [Luteococcus sp.]|uniref:50S ribosomal protein L25/general stress protein Ctc n=1 Tax=Luteococcus sp. TaxID=1969402 RepID=UPI002647D5C3|nr:50S ribosomal protein L25/general stress protein Ctc [Luteococcus sp.]MDN5564318.1 50S ribosomal protein L25/general stress protein Ctc [Luteococcus sp.]
MATNELKIFAEKRTEFGKGAARRIRRADKVPAVLYGHGMEPEHLTLPGHEILLALRTANVLLSLDIAGEKEQLCLPKQVQRDPIKGFIEHVDLLLVKRGEKVTVEVPIVLTGEAATETTVNQDLTALALEVSAMNIPTEIEVSIEGLEAGAQISVADITLPEGATFHGEAAETLIVGINAAEELDEGATEGDEAAGAEVAAAEGESEGE